MYLIDTSALYPLIKSLKENIIDYIDQFRILDLTIYEIGNTIWKEYRRGLIKDLEKTITMFKEILKNIKKVDITPDDLNKIIDLAIKNNITFYDASYIFVADKYGYILVTEDNDIKKSYKNSINTRQLLERLSIHYLHN